jgi:hypothetical protein
MEWQLSMVPVAQHRRPMAISRPGREKPYDRLRLEPMAEPTRWTTGMAAVIGLSSAPREKIDIREVMVETYKFLELPLRCSVGCAR